MLAHERGEEEVVSSRCSAWAIRKSIVMTVMTVAMDAGVRRVVYTRPFELSPHPLHTLHTRPAEACPSTRHVLGSPIHTCHDLRQWGCTCRDRKDRIRRITECTRHHCWG